MHYAGTDLAQAKPALGGGQNRTFKAFSVLLGFTFTELCFCFSPDGGLIF